MLPGVFRKSPKSSGGALEFMVPVTNVHDSAGNAIAITKSGVTYGYIRNLQNDIIALVDGEGNTVVN